MNIRSITILLIITLIFAAIFFYIYEQPSEIKSVVLTQNPLNMVKDAKLFTDKSKEIFILIRLSKVKKNENINILWYKKDTDKLVLMQNNNIKTINDGSGYVKLSLAYKNGNYERGDYLLDIYFNDKKEKSREFTIN